MKQTWRARGAAALMMALTGCAGCDPEQEEREDTSPGPEAPAPVRLDGLPDEGRDALEEPAPGATLNRELGRAVEPGAIVVGDVALARERTCVVDARDGRVWCWGGAGTGDVLPTDVPYDFPVATIHGGGARAHCVVGVDGELGCNGVLDPGWMQASLTSTSTEVSVSDATVCARVTEDRARCWGALDVTLELAGIERVANTDQVVCALASGGVTCAGDNQGGELGVEPEELPSGQREVALPGSATDLTAFLTRYDGFSEQRGFCALVEGAAWCWPRQELDATATLATVAAPARVGARDDLVDLDGGCALSALGDVVCGYPGEPSAVCVPRMSAVLGRAYETGCGVDAVGGEWSCWGGSDGAAGDGSVLALARPTWRCR